MRQAIVFLLVALGCVFLVGCAAVNNPVPVEQISAENQTAEENPERILEEGVDSAQICIAQEGEMVAVKAVTTFEDLEILFSYVRDGDRLKIVVDRKNFRKILKARGFRRAEEARGSVLKIIDSLLPHLEDTVSEWEGAELIFSEIGISDAEAENPKLVVSYSVSILTE